MTGAGGWPLTQSDIRPGEYMLTCPRCDSQSVTMGVNYGPKIGGHGGRLGDPGAVQYNRCNNCGHTTYGR